MMLKPWVQW